MVACMMAFQLTTSQGGRLFDFYNDDIHHYFNSRPRKEVDEKPERTTPKPEKFQLTTSQGGRPMHPFSHQTHLPFQLTTSQGGRPMNPARIEMLVEFQLTTSQGGRQQLHRSTSEKHKFQLTTSQGGRRRKKEKRRLHIHFNSRPRKEVDTFFLP